MLIQCFLHTNNNSKGFIRTQTRVPEPLLTIFYTHDSHIHYSDYANTVTTIANSFCLFFKILPKCHLLYDILLESTRQEFLSCLSLTCKQFTHHVALFTMLLFALYYFFQCISILHQKKSSSYFQHQAQDWVGWLICEMNGRLIDLLHTKRFSKEVK